MPRAKVKEEKVVARPPKVKRLRTGRHARYKNANPTRDPYT